MKLYKEDLKKKTHSQRSKSGWPRWVREEGEKF
jgi:hypothetical protein